MSYNAFINEAIRMLILQSLEEDVSYSKNENIIQGVLRTWAHNLSRDKLRTELYWLAEQGLVTIDDVGGVLVVKLTRRGEDVALGRARTPGVARPPLED